MLGEFNRKPAERRAVDPGEETLDHAWRDDLDAAQAGHLRRIQQIDAPDVSHAWRKLMSGGLSGVEDSNSSVIPVSQRQRHCSQSLRSVPAKRRPGMVPAPCAVGRTSLMLATLSFFSLLTVSGRAPTPQPASSSYRPRIEVWTNRGDDPYASGQAARQPIPSSTMPSRAKIIGIIALLRMAASAATRMSPSPTSPSASSRTATPTALRHRAVLRAAALRLPALPLLRLPQLRELSILEPVRLHLRPF